MTTSILFEQAQLAEAAYANFWDENTRTIITDDEKVIAALKNGGDGFSITQAQGWKKGDRFILCNSLN